MCEHILLRELLITFGFRDSIYFLFESGTALLGKAMFRSIAAAFKSEAPAQALAGILMLVVSSYS